jgi:hypothetical protein
LGRAKASSIRFQQKVSGVAAWVGGPEKNNREMAAVAVKLMSLKSSQKLIILSYYIKLE